jgi:hypothetical protein
MSRLSVRATWLRNVCLAKVHCQPREPCERVYAAVTGSVPFRRVPGGDHKYCCVSSFLPLLCSTAVDRLTAVLYDVGLPRPAWRRVQCCFTARLTMASFINCIYHCEHRIESGLPSFLLLHRLCGLLAAHDLGPFAPRPHFCKRTPTVTASSSNN